jgi:ubiquinone/menaquinone biosynthesis C-methylase UbiE
VRTRLPVRDASVPAVLSAMVHTDMPAYPDVVREAARVLAPGGVFAHIGVHPCFCGGFADRSDQAAIVIEPG